jgi:hypothetical protein
MSIWRLQVITGGNNISQYCLKNDVAAMGWSLSDIQDSKRATIRTFQDYCNLAKGAYKQFRSVHRLAEDVKVGDLIWMRSGGKYHIARIKDNSVWKFCNEPEALNRDTSNQRIKVKWYPATANADEGSVPGAIATAFIKGSTFQRIKKGGVEEYSQMLYNKIHDVDDDPYFYPTPNISLTESNFYSLLQPEDTEDLLSLWLYHKKGYICIPSTNKIATPKYECVLIDPLGKSVKHIYIQVKKGDVLLDAEEYKDLAGEVYLFTTEGNVINTERYDNIFKVDPSTLFEFAIYPENKYLIPESILHWINFLAEIENSRNV